MPALTAFDCLLDYGADTARERIPPAVKEFVADDLAGGGVLIHTLLGYAATDFNVKLAAHRLHVHHNTAALGNRDVNAIADGVRLLTRVDNGSATL